MFGRHPRLPIDLEYGVTQPELTSTSVHNYAKKLKTRLQWAYDRALHNNRKSLEDKRNIMTINSDV